MITVPYQIEHFYVKSSTLYLIESIFWKATIFQLTEKARSPSNYQKVSGFLIISGEMEVN